MKSGVIVYAAGEAPKNWTEKDETRITFDQFKADAIEIITSRTGHFDVLDAWWYLLTRGTAHIVCKMAKFNDSGELVLTGREFRVYG